MLRLIVNELILIKVILIWREFAKLRTDTCRTGAYLSQAMDNYVLYDYVSYLIVQSYVTTCKLKFLLELSHCYQCIIVSSIVSLMNPGVY